MERPSTPFDAEVVGCKLRDAATPGAVVELDPAEAEHAGAFIEEALTLQEALDSALDGVVGSVIDSGTDEPELYEGPMP